MEKQKKELMLETIKKSWIVNKDGYIDSDADYCDEMDPTTALEIVSHDHPMETFFDTLEEWYWDTVEDCRRDLAKEVVDAFKKAGLEVTCDDENEVSEYIGSEVGYVLPEDHFLDQEFEVNLMVDTGDMNYDFVLNDIFPHYDSGSMNDAISKRASITWLLEQQGYSRSQYKGYLRGAYKENKFLASVYQELLNCSSHMNALTVLTHMSLRDIISVTEQMKKKTEPYSPWKNKDLGKIVIDKNAMIGLFDVWSGAGSIMELSLEKDLVLPIKYLWKIQIDGARGRGYDVGSVYGMCGSAWNGKLKEIVLPKAGKKVAA